MPDALWILLCFIGAALFLLLALVVVEKAWGLWKRYRHENGTPDLRRFPRHDDPPSEDKGGRA